METQCERREVKLSSKAQQSFHEVLFDHIEHIVYRLDFESGRYDYLSAAAAHLFGLSLEETRAGGMTLVAKHMLPGDYERSIRHLMLVCKAHPGESLSTSVDYGVRDADGVIHYFHDSMSIEIGAQGVPLKISGIAVDVSERVKAEIAARDLADFDSLTGLPNRRLLADRFAHLHATAIRERSEIALFFLDLDHFKRVNDSLGHSVGDKLLCAVAERLLTAIRKVDTLARLGGDEFIFAMPGINAAAAAEIARRLLEVCNTPFLIAGHELTMTPSLGVSIFPHDGDDLEVLMRNADMAMYKAKDMGRNAFQFFASEMNTATLEHLLMESSLRRAVGQKEFVLHYQPLVSLATGKIVGVEALVRWSHHDLGMIMPDRFIHVAEDTGLINALGDWVLCEACRQAMIWQDAGLPPLVIAVNVSPVQFRQAGFIEAVAGALATSGLEADFLELELTERTVMHDAESTLGTLSAIHRMGVELALDDFGTGYSSLAYLKRFPVGKLKIDRSFVNDLETDPEDQAIASTIVSMGRNLNLTVLAEGIETREQLLLLRDMGCEMGQGFYFSRAVPPEAMAILLRDQPFLFQSLLFED